MDNQALKYSGVMDILDKAVKDISTRVAGLSMRLVSECEIRTENRYSLFITTSGDYSVSIILNMDQDVMRLMTECMKHGAVINEGDIPIYMTEFFNILCGHIVSAVNRKFHMKARFGIPQIRKGFYTCGLKQQHLLSKRYFYDCGYGKIMLEVLFNDSLVLD